MYIDNWLYHGYTTHMKTAISIPDRLYADAEETAKSMGIPRSQLYAKAIEEFISTHKNDRITEQLNDVYHGTNAFSESIVSVVGLESIRELTKNDSW
jgi:metal-responsive CopG/Arc/MetJ family transcriptional regulator